MQAGLERVRAATPAHGETAGHIVHLKDFDFVTDFEGIDGGREPGDSAADDDDLFAVALHVDSLRNRRAMAGVVLTGAEERREDTPLARGSSKLRLGLQFRRG